MLIRSVSFIVSLTILTASISACTPKAESNTSSQNVPGTTSSSTSSSQVTNPEKSAIQPIFTVEKLNSDEKPTDESLVEITDPGIILEISELIPETKNILDQTSGANVSDEDVFMVQIPLQLEESTSKDLSELSKGINVDPALVKKYADLFKNDFNVIIKNPIGYFTNLSKVYGLVCKVAEIAVAAETDEAFSRIDDNVQKISGFQDREFKSKIMASLSEVNELAQYESEIKEKEEVRLNKLHKLEDVKSTILQLLDQINITIKEQTSNEKVDFEKYVKVIDGEAIPLEQQQALLSILEEISNLSFALSKGNISTDLSFSSYREYVGKSNEARTYLSKWHEEQIDTFGIDIENKRLTKQGVEGILWAIPGVFNKDLKKKELSDEFVNAITKQTKNNAIVEKQPTIITGQYVTIIIKNGDIYFLQNSESV